MVHGGSNQGAFEPLSVVMQREFAIRKFVKQTTATSVALLLLNIFLDWHLWFYSAVVTVLSFSCLSYIHAICSSIGVTSAGGS